MGYSNGLLESDEKGGSGERGEQGLPGIGFKLTDDGNFDIDGKRLTDVSQPVDGRDATTKAYVDGEIGHHTGNFYHLRQSFTFYDSSGTELALSTDSITGLVTDYKHGYYKIPKSGDDNYFSTLDIKIRNNLPQSTYSALFYLYGYKNNSIMSGVDLGPILFGVDGTNYNILKYDDDDTTETRNHTKGIIWFTSDGSAQSQHSGYNGSIELSLRFFDKSITHFVILSRCVEGKVNLGFSSNIFNVSSTVGNVTLYFEDINMNRRKIKNLGGPTDDGDVTNKKYVDLYSGLYGNEFYHLRSEFTVFDHNIVSQQIQSSNIQGLLTDYNLGYYKLPPTSTHGNIRDCEFILSNYDLKVGTYTILLFMYAYENGTKLTGQELGPTISSATSSNLSILRYADDNSINTVDHTKGVIWLNATGQGSVKVKISYFNSLTHFVFLHRCVQGKVGVGFINDVFNVKHVDDAVLFFDKINMNNLEITNISNPTGPKQALTLGYGDDRYIRTDGANAMKNDFRMGGKRIVGLDDPINDSQVATKKYVDTENVKQDIAINDKASKSYVDDEIAKVHIDTTPLLPRDGSRGMTGDFDNGGNNILKVENLTDYKDTDPYDYRVKDVKSVVNKEYLNEKFMKKVDKDGREYYDLKGNIIRNCEPYYDGLFTDNDLVSKKYVDTENAKQDIAINSISSISAYNINLITALQTSKADQSYVDDNFLNLDGSKSMTGNLNTDGNYIDGLPELVEDDTSDETLAKIKGRAIDFGYFHTERGELKRLINSVSSDALNRKDPDPMEDDIDMANHSIVNLKDPQPSDSSYAASVNFVNKTVDNKIKESEERSIRSLNQENVFKKVMDDGLFIEDDDDIHQIGVVDKDFHKVNKKTYHFQIDYDNSIGYYSTRLGVNVVYLPIGYYILAFEMFFSDKIDNNNITVDCLSGTIQILSKNTKYSSDHSRSIFNFRKTVARPSDDEVDIDITLKNKSGETYDSKTDIYVVVYGVEGLGNDVESIIWDRYFYVDDKKIHFEAPIDMVNKDIENVNDLSINNELNMNNR